jgi:ABC-2 type transport system permease protein
MSARVQSKNALANTAVFATFSSQPGTAAFRWQDLLIMVIWGAAGALVALRRFRWEPRRR